MSKLSKTFASPHEGFEVSVHRWKMTLKMHFMLFLLSAFFFLVFLYFLFISKLSPYQWQLLRSLSISWASVHLGELASHFDFNIPVIRPQVGSLYETSFANLRYYPQYMAELQREFSRSLIENQVGIYSSFLAWAIWPLSVLRFRLKAQEQRDDQFIRGAKLISAKTLGKQTKKTGDLPFGPVKMPVENEVLHSLVVGAAGSGKTVLLSGLLERMIERQEQVIIHDFKGDFTERFYNPARDLIFNACDQRGLNWNLFDEIDQSGLFAAELDAKYIASVLFPADSREAIWYEAPRSVFVSIVLRLIEKGMTTNQDLATALSLNREDLEKIIANSDLDQSALRHVMGGNYTQSILAILEANTNWVRFMAGSTSGFSMEEWLTRGQGCIFLLNNSRTQEAMRPILTLFLDLLVRKLLNFSDSPDRRVFFLLDELGQLAKSQSLKNLITQGRSKGAAVFMGIQDIGQLDKIYGEKDKISIINSTNNSAVFKLNEPTTAKYFADKIGRQEILETNDSKSMGAAPVRDGVSISSNRRELYVVRPDDYTNLKTMQCYLHFSNHSPALVQLEYKHRPVTQEKFLLNPGREFRRASLQANESNQFQTNL